MVCVFLVYSFVLASTNPSFFQFKGFAGSFFKRFGGFQPPPFSVPPRMRYSLMLPSTGPPSSLSIYYKTTESVKCQVILVLLIGDIWRETQIKRMQRASKNLTPATRGKLSEISHPPVKSFTPLSLNSGRRKSISFLLLNSGPLKHLPLKTALFPHKDLNCVHTHTHTAPLLRVINIA